MQIYCSDSYHLVLLLNTMPTLLFWGVPFIAVFGNKLFRSFHSFGCKQTLWNTLKTSSASIMRILTARSNNSCMIFSSILSLKFLLSIAKDMKEAFYGRMHFEVVLAYHGTNIDPQHSGEWSMVPVHTCFARLASATALTVAEHVSSTVEVPYHSHLIHDFAASLTSLVGLFVLL